MGGTDYCALYHAITALFTTADYTDLTLTTHQQEQIRKMLESHEGTTFGRKNIAGSATSAITRTRRGPDIDTGNRRKRS